MELYQNEKRDGKKSNVLFSKLLVIPTWFGTCFVSSLIIVCILPASFPRRRECKLLENGCRLRIRHDGKGIICKYYYETENTMMRDPETSSGDIKYREDHQKSARKFCIAFQYRALSLIALWSTPSMVTIEWGLPIFRRVSLSAFDG